MADTLGYDQSVYQASDWLVNSIAATTRITLPLWYSVAGVVHKYSMRLTKTIDQSATKWEAHLVASGETAVYIGTFTLLEAALAATVIAGPAKLKLATPEAAVMLASATTANDQAAAIMSTNFGDNLSNFIGSPLWFEIKKIMGWTTNGVGKTGQFNIQEGTNTTSSETNLNIKPNTKGFSVETTSNSTSFDFHGFSKNVTEIFQDAFYSVTDKAELLFKNDSDLITGIAASTPANVLNAPGDVYVFASAGNDLINRSGTLTVNQNDHSIIDGGAGQDTISYEQVTNLTGGIEIALQDGGLNHGVSTPRGTDYGIPLDLLDFVEHAAGTNYNDSIIGSDGNNQLAGAGGSDTLIGGKGNDVLSGFWINTFGAAPSAGDTGEDVADYSKAAAGIKIDFTKTGSQINDGDGGVDSIYSIEKIIGSGKDDTLVYSEAIQTISSVFTVDAGGGKADTVDFSKYTKAVTYTLNGKIGITETDNFENIIGSKQADKLTGDAKNNIIFSGGGNDTLTGGAGADAYNITGTGTVTVNDTGQGDFLAIGNNLFYGAASKNGTTYNLNGYTLQKVGADLTVTGDVGTITLKNWVEGDYNISLRGAPGKTILFSPCGTFVYPGDGYGMQQAALNLAYQILGVYTPLVIDLNKNGGVELTEIYSTNARFDIDADGYAEHSGWIKPTDGFLVVDKNGNGVIDNQTEMFGADASGTAWAKLKAYDSNKDGKVTSADANWAKLKVWKDLDQDQWTDSGELFAPTAVGVYGFKYAKEAYSKSPGDATAFNAIDGRAAFLNSSGGNAGYMYDVLFTTDDRDTVYVGNNLKSQSAISFTNLMAYPQHEGQGNVLPLHQAVIGNTALQNALKAFVAMPTGTDSNKLDAPIINILKAWANIGATANDHELKKAILTAFDGSISTSPGALQNPWQTAYDVLPRSVEDQFGILMDELRASLAPQGPYAKFFTNGYYSFADNLYHVNDTAEAIIARAKSSQPTDPIEKSFFWSGLFHVLQYTEGLTVGGIPNFTDDAFINAIHTAAGTDVFIANEFGRVADNETVDTRYVYDSPAIAYYVGSDGANTILVGGIGKDTIYGNGGNDSISGSGQLFGGAGNDTLDAFSPNSATLSGGTGSNEFYGASNAQIKYVIGKDVVQVTDTIHEFYTPNQKIDLTALGTGLTLNLQQFEEDTQFNVGNHKIIIKDVLPSELKLSNFIGVTTLKTVVSNTPTDGPDNITGTANADTIDALNGNDTIYGLAGNDWLRGGYGNDIMYGGDGNDTIEIADNDTVYGGLGSNTYYNNSSSNITLFIISNDSSPVTETIWSFNARPSSGKYEKIDLTALGTNLTLNLKQQGSQTQFSVGTHSFVLQNTVASELTLNNFIGVSTLNLSVSTSPSNGDDSITGTENADRISAQIGNDTIIGLGGNDTLNGDSGNNSIDGGAGNDSISGGFDLNTIIGGLGNDFMQGGVLYKISQGDGADTIDYSNNSDGIVSISFGQGISYSGLIFSLTTDHQILIGVPGGGSVKIIDDNIDILEFFDQTTKTLDDAKRILLTNATTVGNDTIVGFRGNDSIVGGKGNDSLLGGAGNDTFSFSQGDGNDTIAYEYDDDTYSFGSGITWENIKLSKPNADDLLITIPGGGSVLIKGAYPYDEGEIYKFGTINKTTTDIINRIISEFGTSGNDTIYGFGREETINAGAGNDLITGDSDETVLINTGNGLDTIQGGIERILFGSGINWNNIGLQQVGRDGVLINVPGGGTVFDAEFLDRFSTNTGVEELKFNDLSVKTQEDVENFLLTKNSTAGDDIILVGQYSVNVNSLAGNDRIEAGSAFESAFNGGDGNDTIFSSSSEDTITGGKGDDLIYDEQDAVFIINQGEGNDTIYADNYTYGYDGNNIISFGSGIAFTNLIIKHTTADGLYVGLPGGGSILLPDLTIDQFKFADNSTKIFSEIAQLADTQATTPGNDSIVGFTTDETINGAAGNDTILAKEGADTLIGGAGVDTLTGGSGNDLFDYNAITESTKAAPDVITDFDTSADMIDLRGLGFTGVAAGAASGTKLGFTYDVAANDTIIVATSDFKIILDGNKALDASDFIFS